MTDRSQWPAHRFLDAGEYNAALRRARDLGIDDRIQAYPARGPGTVMLFETVAIKDQILPPAFVRGRPRFRLFADDGVGGKWTWWEVNIDNTVGAPATNQQIADIDRMLADAPWAASFWDAFERHGKATVYEQ